MPLGFTELITTVKSFMQQIPRLVKNFKIEKMSNILSSGTNVIKHPYCNLCLYEIS